jgi:hypothetical protein
MGAGSLSKTATKKELEARVTSLEGDMKLMNELVSRLMMHKLLTEVMAEIQMWMNSQGVNELDPIAVQWITQPAALQKAVQEVMVEANKQFENRKNGLVIWEELKGFMMARLFVRLEKKTDEHTEFTTH